MNKIFIIGNLTRDPELSETAGGTSVCRFSVAVNRNYTDDNGERQVDFFNVTAWRGTAEAVAKYARKGKKIAILGSVQIRNWEDNQGNKWTSVDIIAQDVEFLSPRDDGERGGTGERETLAGQLRKKPSLQAFDDDGDIPF